jgi:N-methylhydantoinase B
MVGIHLSRGRRVRLETPGGGGWGDPLVRDPAAVARDVTLGYVTADAARDLYRVAVDAHGALDTVATARLRGTGA